MSGKVLISVNPESEGVYVQRALVVGEGLHRTVLVKKSETTDYVEFLISEGLDVLLASFALSEYFGKEEILLTGLSKGLLVDGRILTDENLDLASLIIRAY